MHKKHCLSLLVAGVVSVAGGCQPEESTASTPATWETQAARLDEAVGTWSASAPQLTSTGWRTATLLDSGLVLSVRSSSSELYNPYTDTWQSLGWGPYNPYAQRTGGTVTKLPSGKVLLAGGSESSDGPGNSPMAALFDPATNTWTSTAPMATGRVGHTATLLDSGQVLVVAGNYNLKGQTGAAELYDPATGTWSNAGALPEGVSGHTATRLYSGQVLITGGYQFYPFAESSSGPINKVYLYDLATKTFTPLGNMAKARAGHSALRLYSGSVLVFGGTRDNNDTSSEVYDPYNNQWLAGPSLPIAGPYVSATMLYSGEVLVLNGSGQGALYDPSANAWHLAAPTQANGNAAAVLLQTGQVLAIGDGAVQRFSR